MAEAAVVGIFGGSLGAPPPPGPGPLRHLGRGILSSAGRRLRRIGTPPAGPRTWLILGGSLGLCEAAGLDPSLGLLGAIEGGLPHSSMLPPFVRFPLSLLLFSSALWLLLALILRLGLRLLLLRGGSPGPGPPPQIWTALVRMFSGRRPGLRGLQGALPALPLPPLRETVTQAVQSLQLLHPQFGEALPPLARGFLGGPGPQIQRWLRLRGWALPSYLSELWEEQLPLSTRGPLPKSSRFYLMDILGPPPTRVPAARAANVAFAFLRFQKLLRNGTLPPVLFQGSLPTCSAQYERIFGTARVPGEQRDQLLTLGGLSDLPVMFGGRLFRVGEGLSPPQLQRSFQKILETPGSPESPESPESPAVLTAGDRCPWARARTLLLQGGGPGSAALRLLEAAPFLVTFDPPPENPPKNGETPGNSPQKTGETPKNNTQKNGETPKNNTQKNGETPKNNTQKTGETPKNGGTPKNKESPKNGETPKNWKTPENPQKIGETPENGESPKNGETPRNGETPKNGGTPPEERDPPRDGDLDAEAKALLLGPPDNRWFDKSLTLVVFPSGRVGLSVELSWGDPAVAAHLWEFALAVDRSLGYDHCGNCRGEGAAESSEPPRELQWNLPPQVSGLLPRARQQFQALSRQLQLHVISLETPPGPPESARELLALALELALLRERGPALTYESVSTRLFLEGRTDGARGVGRPLLELERALRDPETPRGRRRALLEAALSQARARRRAAMMGAGLERHLQALAAVANQMQLRPPFLTEVLGQPWDLAFSPAPRPHPPLLPHPLQPAGMGFNPPHQDGYGVSFTGGGDAGPALVHISCREGSPKTDPRLFSQRLRAALAELGELGQLMGGEG